MDIYVKYCGGCNPRYDRVKELNNLLRKHSGINVSYDCEGSFDIAVIICGCESACVDVDSLKFSKIFWLKNKDDFKKFDKYLQTHK